jgi:hypothetical protein
MPRTYITFLHLLSKDGFNDEPNLHQYIISTYSDSEFFADKQKKRKFPPKKHAAKMNAGNQQYSIKKSFVVRMKRTSFPR